MKRIFLLTILLLLPGISLAISGNEHDIFGTAFAQAAPQGRAAVSSGTTTTAAICLQETDEAYLFILDADAVSGTTPTLDVKIQNSPDGKNWVDISGGAFTQVTTVDKYFTTGISLTPLGKCFRAVLVSAGTTPVYNAAVRLYTRKVL